MQCNHYIPAFKVVAQPAASADLSGVVFSLSNPNVSSHVTGQKCTLYFLQIRETIDLQLIISKHLNDNQIPKTVLRVLP